MIIQFGLMCGCGLNSQHVVWATQQYTHVEGNEIGEEFQCDIHVSWRASVVWKTSKLKI